MSKNVNRVRCKQYDLVTYIYEGFDRVGVIVARKIGDRVNIGWSICNEKDEFKRNKGLMIALNRADSSHCSGIPQKYIDRYNLDSILNDFAKRCEKYFKVDNFAVRVPELGVDFTNKQQQKKTSHKELSEVEQLRNQLKRLSSRVSYLEQEVGMLEAEESY
jgi:hypothetical protein